MQSNHDVPVIEELYPKREWQDNRVKEVTKLCRNVDLEARSAIFDDG